MSVGIESNNFIFGLFSAYSDLSFLDHSDNELKKVSKILQTQKGIQNVIYQFDRKSGRVGISFDFTNSKSLNKALYAIANHEKTIFMPAVYKVNKHSFSRKNTTKWLNMLMEQNEEKLPDELLLELVRVNSVYQFPKPVRKIKGSNVTVNEDGMVVSTSNVLSDILEQNINTRIRVRF